MTAHRGAFFDDAENTLPAFERAVASKADMIEFDLRMTADGVPIVLHDKTIDRTSDGTGAPEEHTLAVLKKLNFSYCFRKERLEKPLYPQLKITTFEEVLKNFRDKACMNIHVENFFKKLLISLAFYLIMNYIKVERSALST